MKVPAFVLAVLLVWSALSNAGSEDLEKTNQNLIRQRCSWLVLKSNVSDPEWVNSREPIPFGAFEEWCSANFHLLKSRSAHLIVTPRLIRKFIANSDFRPSTKAKLRKAFKSYFASVKQIKIAALERIKKCRLLQQCVAAERGLLVTPVPVADFEELLSLLDQLNYIALDLTEAETNLVIDGITPHLERVFAKEHRDYDDRLSEYVLRKRGDLPNKEVCYQEGHRVVSEYCELYQLQWMEERRKGWVLVETGYRRRAVRTSGRFDAP